VGDLGLMLFQRGNTNWIVTPSSRLEALADLPRTIPRVANEDAEWIEACKGGPKALSSFDYSGPLTEMVCWETWLSGSENRSNGTLRR
jgi:hypothetical protein